MTLGTVVSLCDRTGVMVRPWAEAGYHCYCADLQNTDRSSEKIGDGYISWVPADVRNWRLSGNEAIVFAFPPCTNLAVSGAKHFRNKGLRGLIDGLEVVEACREICEKSGAPWMLENPVSTLSSHWREPDYIFHPHEYGGYSGGENDNYTKKTCLWVGGGFVIPPKKTLAGAPLFGVEEVEPDDRIHKAPPSEERGDLRSVTPAGFARAVFEANHAAEAETTWGPFALNQGMESD